MKRTLLQLLVENIGHKVGTRIEFAAKEGDVAHVYLYDPIVSDKWMAEYFGGVCAQDLVPELHKITGDAVMHINCPGGDVFAMQAIMAAVKNMPGHVTAIVEGLCASAATGIAVSCDEVIMEAGAQWMVHNSQGMVLGDKNDLRALADVMDQVDDGMVAAYVEKTGKDEKQVRAWMDAETWFKAQDAVDAGFADKVNEPPKKKGAKAATEWKLTAYTNAPKPPAVDPTPEPQEPEQISDEDADHLRRRMRMMTMRSNQFTSALAQ